MTASSILSLTDDNNINHDYRTTVIDSNNGATIIVDVVTNEDVDNTNNDHPMLDNSNNRQRIEVIDENNSNDCVEYDNEQIQLAITTTTTTVLPQQKQQQQQQQLPEAPIPSPLLHLTTSTATTVADTAVQHHPLIAPVRVATTTTSNTDAISEHNAPMSLPSSSPPLDSSLSNQLVEKKKSIPPTTTKVNRQQQQQLPTFKDQLCASSSSSPIILNPSMVAVEVTQQQQQQPQEDEIEHSDRMNSVYINHNNPVGRSSGGGVAIPMNGSGDSVIKERKLFPSSLDNNNIFNSGDDPTISTLTTNSTTFLPQHEQQSQQQQHRQQEEYWASSQANEVSIAEPPTIHAELVVESPVYPYPNNYNYFNNSSNNYTTTNTTSSSASSSQSVLPPLVYATPMLLSEQQQQGANSGNSDKNQPTQEHDAIPTKESITTTTSRKRRPYIILGIVLSVVLLIVGTVVVTVVMTTRIVSNEYHSQSSATPNGSNNTIDGDDNGPTPSSYGSTTTSCTMPDIKGAFASWILVDGADQQQLQQQPGQSSSKSSYSIDATTAYDPDAKLDPSSTFVLDPSVPVNTIGMVSIDFSNDGLTMILANIQPCSNTNTTTKTTTTTDCSTGLVTVYKYVHRQWLSVNTLNTSRTSKNTTTITSDVVVAMDSSTSSTSNKVIFAVGTVQKVLSKREMVPYRTVRVYQIQSHTDDRTSNQYPGSNFPDSHEYEKVTTTQLGPDLPLDLSSSEEDSVATKMDVTKGGRIVVVGVSSSFNTNATCFVRVYRLVQSNYSDNTSLDPEWATMGQTLPCGYSVMKYSAIQRIQLSNDGITLLVVTESSNTAMNTTTANNYYHNRKKGGTSSITTVQTFRYVNDTWTPILPKNKPLGDMISSFAVVTPEAKATSLSDAIFDNTTENEHTDFGIITAALSNDGKVLVQCDSSSRNGTQIIGICYTFRSYRRADTTILEWKQFGSDIPIADAYQPLANTDITSVSLSDDGRTLVVAGLLSTPEEESDGYIWTVAYNRSDAWDVSDLNMIWTSRSNISVAFDDVAPIYVWLSDKGDKLLVYDDSFESAQISNQY